MARFILLLLCNLVAFQVEAGQSRHTWHRLDKVDSGRETYDDYFYEFRKRRNSGDLPGGPVYDTIPDNFRVIPHPAPHKERWIDKLKRYDFKPGKVDGLSIAVGVATTAAGWIIDELTDQVMNPVSVDSEGDYYYHADRVSRQVTGVAPSGSSVVPEHTCFAGSGRGAPSGYAVSDGVETPGGYGVFCQGAVQQGSCKAPHNDNAKSICQDNYLEPVPWPDVADEMWNNPVTPDPDGSVIRELFKNDQGDWVLDQEAFDKYNQWLEEWAANTPGYDFDPDNQRLTYTDPNGGTVVVNPDGTMSPWENPDDGSNPDDDTGSGTNPDDGTGTGTDTGTDTGSGTGSGIGSGSGSVTNITNNYNTTNNNAAELPAFCQYAEKLCEWINWTQEEFEEPEPEEFPTNEVSALSYYEDWDAGLGGGACPPDLNISFMGKTVTVLPSEPICVGLKDYVKPVAILLASFIAVAILAGRNMTNA
ncbi:hypothetical protein [Neptunomonas sp. XY-337]|uniref:hypothetical protein n=1 Tax=Neptunomonas sp. XY-337 TaxID=2561897 RepID=UPI0010AA86D6|nr:hypothetical protein [Neptunomonas sp. XY-337]